MVYVDHGGSMTVDAEDYKEWCTWYVLSFFIFLHAAVVDCIQICNATCTECLRVVFVSTLDQISFQHKPTNFSAD